MKLVIDAPAGTRQQILDALAPAYPELTAHVFSDALAAAEDASSEPPLVVFALDGDGETLERLRTLRTILPGAAVILLLGSTPQRWLSNLPGELDYYPLAGFSGEGLRSLVGAIMLRLPLPPTSLTPHGRPSRDAFEELRRSQAAFRDLHRITADPGADFGDKLQRLLHLGIRYFGLPVGIVSHIEGNKYYIHASAAEGTDPIPPGTVFPLEQTYCERTVRAHIPVGFEHAAESEWHEHPAYRALRLEAYIGMPIFTGDRLFGTLNFSSPEPAPDVFRPLNVELLKVMARWIGTELLRQEHEQKLELSAVVFDSTSEAIMVTDADAVIIDVNQAFTAITGYRRDEAVGRGAGFMSSGVHDRLFFRTMWQDLRETGAWKGEIWDRRKNGELYPKLLAINAVHDKEGKTVYYVGVFSDVTAAKETEERLDYLAHYDALTALPNRTLFQEEVRKACARAERGGPAIAVMYIDLDRFKLVNDTFGHAAADRLLIDVADRFRSALQDTDILSRLAGDVFAALFVDAAEVADRADALMGTLAQPFAVAGQEVFVTASGGIGLYPSEYADGMEALLRSADTAMYIAKEKGRNNYQFFHAEPRGISLERFSVGHDLHRALDRGEFVLHYQPKWDLFARRVAGVEALVRWRHPSRGLLLPEEFIHVAEETGIIVPLGEWVLRTACRQAAEWKRHGLGELVMSVNVSSSQLQRGGLVEVVSAALEESCIEPSLLELELSENTLAHDVGETRATIRRLKALGVKISIDDFGTGYASISFLRQFPVDVLKVDRSFLQEVPRSDAAADLCNAIIAIGRSLHLEVVAEGVETAEQLRFVQTHHCRQVQGYVLARPLPSEGFKAWLDSEPEPGQPQLLSHV